MDSIKVVRLSGLIGPRIGRALPQNPCHHRCSPPVHTTSKNTARLEPVDGLELWEERVNSKPVGPDERQSPRWIKILDFKIFHCRGS